jgi:hypothetical protein
MSKEEWDRLAKEEWDRRKPPPPETLVDALQDCVHIHSAKSVRLGKSIKIPLKNKYYISFGQAHKHNVEKNEINHDCLVLIIASNRQEATQKAKNLFQDQWSMIYSESEITENDILDYWPRGIIKLG